jgi:hypothetical protein
MQGEDPRNPEMIKTLMEGRRTEDGGRLWSNCVSQQGGIRDGKRGMCAPFGGMDAADCIAEPVVLAESHCIVP